jgi:hypothetical protein
VKTNKLIKEKKLIHISERQDGPLKKKSIRNCQRERSVGDILAEIFVHFGRNIKKIKQYKIK